MSTIRNDRKFASPVKKEGKAIENVGAELGEGELKQVVGGSLTFGRIEWTYTKQKPDGTGDK
jgi:hypothetical protein